MRLDIRCQLLIGLRHDPDADVHIGWCPALDLYSQGRTKSEALGATTSAVSFYLKHCYQRQILDDVLNRRGFKPSPTGPGDAAAAPQPTTQSIAIRELEEMIDAAGFTHTATIDVPLHLVAAEVKAGRIGGSQVCLS